jgi:hypothetical protein
MALTVRLWKIAAQDQGLQALAEYLVEFPQVEILDLLDNSITYLGCNYLGKIYKSIPDKIMVKCLYLDHNVIGDKGMKILAEGLRKSTHLKGIGLNRAVFELLRVGGAVIGVLAAGAGLHPLQTGNTKPARQPTADQGVLQHNPSTGNEQEPQEDQHGRQPDHRRRVGHQPTRKTPRK